MLQATLVSMLLYCAHLQLRDTVIRNFEYRIEATITHFMKYDQVSEKIKSMVRGKDPKLFLQNVSILVVMSA